MKAGEFVRVTELFLGDYIYRGEGITVGEPLDEIVSADISRLVGQVGTVVEEERIGGYESHTVIRVRFYKDEEWCFSKMELTATECEPTVTPPPFVETTNYISLTGEERDVAKQVFLTALKSFDQERIDSLLFNSGKMEELISDSIVTSRKLVTNLNLMWSYGVKLVPQKDW